MMSLWKLRVGVESYYLAQVASGLDEYYTGAGEAAGQWGGSGSALLGLSGDVGGEDLRAVLAGLAPNTGLTPNGARLITHARRVPGFDLTFAVPKSVSVVFALGDPLVQSAVVESCETALEEALAWLEREACFVRRGTNNRAMAHDAAAFGTRRMVGEGFVAAQFPHRTSRLGDPHLHWHVLVANMARGVDGRWTALDGQALYRTQRTVGVLFQAAMRRELTERLGIEWGPMHRDAAEVAGVPTQVLREFSQRADQIAEWLDHRGVEGAAAAGQALLDTRTSKQAPTDFGVVEAGWRDRADQLGWGPAQLDQLLASSPRARTSETHWVVPNDERSGGPHFASTVDFHDWLEWLLASRVTEKSATFTRFDLTQAVAAAMPAWTKLGTIEATVNRALASTAITPAGDHWRTRKTLTGPTGVVADDREQIYTSTALLVAERKLVAQIASGVVGGVGVAPADVLDRAIEASGLGPDQREAVWALATQGDRVSVMVGRAGTGKTHTLGTVRSLYEKFGWRVIGLAPSARAAREMQDGARIDSTTIARHLVEQRTVDATTLVVVDEAAMGGTRDIAAIVSQVSSARGKVLLVGDHHQLPEVATGGAFRAALDVLGDRAVELTTNRRQRLAWERDALDQLRCGDVHAAFDAYRNHGRVVIADNPEDLHALVLGDWLDARSSGDTLLLAGTRAQARLLNRHARLLRGESGELDLSAEITFAGRGFVVGDEIVLGRNDRRQHLATGEPFAVDNGMRGTITDLSADHMAVRITNGDRVVLNRDYLDRGWVDHAYAVTVHKAQGATCDSVLVVGPAGLYREGAYVALSRARNEARLYATVEQAAEVDERHQHGIPLPTEQRPDLIDDLLTRLQTSAAKQLATIEDPDADRVADLVATTPAPQLLARALHAAEAEHTCGAADPAEVRASFDAAIDTRTHIAIGRRVRALDRDNVGHVLDIDDGSGTCVVEFDSVDGRIATKTFDWAELVVIDHPTEVELTPGATETLRSRGEDVNAAEHSWAAALSECGVAPGDADLLRRAVHTSADQAARALRAEQPDWLTTWLGERPTTHGATTVWDDTVDRIAHYRALHDVSLDAHGIGARPDDPTDRVRWDDLMVRILENRLWLTDGSSPQPVAVRALTPTELVARRDELDALLATAPPDQHAFIERIARSELDPSEMHEYLTAATDLQDDRRAWILANWPHLVELEQVTCLIAQQQPLAHWPTAHPAEVQSVLDELKRTSPRPDTREERSLAELDRTQRDQDPVQRLESRRHELRKLAGKATGREEREAVEAELARVGKQLQQARRDGAVEQAFGRYETSPIEAACTSRIATIAHDTIISQPTWMVDGIRELHENGQLSGYGIGELASRIVDAATHLDRHGDLPADWNFPTQIPAQLPAPPIEVGN